MATATELPPVNPLLAYGGFSENGVGSGTPTAPEQVTQEILPFQPLMPPNYIQLSGEIGELARPTGTVFLGALLDPKLRLLKPIPLEASNEDSGVVLSWEEVDEFGCGSTTGAAFDDFGQSLRELYDHLHLADVRLGEDLQRIKNVLDQYIERRG
jgi:hypothetical protein